MNENNKSQKEVGRLKKNMCLLSKILGFPFNVLSQDKVLWIWIITTILAGFFTVFSDIFLGRELYESFSQGIVYIFSITLLIPVISDSIIYFYSEDRKVEAEQNVEHITKKKLLPIIKKYSITRHLSLILFFDVMIMLFSVLLYLGNYKTNICFQVLAGIISLYITFYYFCLNRVIQYPQNYNDYIENEKDELNNLVKNSNGQDVYTNEDGEEVKL